MGKKEDEEKEFRKSELQRILPLAWNSYQHMYDTRERNIQGNINFLLIAISFLFVVSISLLSFFKEEWFLFPLMMQFISFLILIKSSFMTRKNFILWMEIKSTFNKIEEKEFDISFFSSLKALEDDTWTYLSNMQNLIKHASSILFASLFSTAGMLLYIYLEKILVALFIILLLFLIYEFYMMKQPHYSYNETYEKFKIQTRNWLNLKS